MKEETKISANTGISLGLLVIIASVILTALVTEAVRLVNIEHSIKATRYTLQQTWKISDQERWILKCKELNPSLDLKFPDPREMVREWNKIPE